MAKAKQPVDVATAQELSYNNAGLPAFPREVLEAKKVRSLDLFRAIRFDGDATIPAGIGQLRTLRSLTLGGLAFESLPDSIGDLADLEELALDYCGAKTLPATIGKLGSLRELSLGYAESLTALPPEIGQLAKLEKLAFTNTPVTSVPVELWNATRLKELALPQGVTSLPPGIGALASLESLHLSPAALASIAEELPKLQSLKVLSTSVSGEAGTLPDEIGSLVGLEELAASFNKLKRLPSSLVNLKELHTLDVAGNELTELAWLLTELPKLKDLDYSDNRLPPEEKRLVQSLMKLPPSKRAKVDTAAPGAKKKKAGAPAIPAEPLGRVASINAYLAMVVADAKIAKSWGGTGDGSNLDGSDWKRASDLLDDTAVATIDIGKKKKVKATLLHLGVGQGIAHVFRVGDRITLAEVFCEDLEDAFFKEWIASPPTKQAKKSGAVKIESARATLLPTMVSGASEGDTSSLSFDLKSGRYALLVEPETKDAWGHGRRAHLVRG